MTTSDSHFDSSSQARSSPAAVSEISALGSAVGRKASLRPTGLRMTG